MKNAVNAVISLAMIITLASCDSGAQKPKRVIRAQPAAETIKLVFPPEVSTVLSKAVEAFHRLDVKLPNGLKINFEKEELNSLDAAQKIARGDVKATMWVVPLPALTEYVNSHLVNLGAKQTECKKLFSTGLVAATSRGNRKKLAGISPTIETSQLFNNKIPRQLSFNSPTYSDSGLAASLYIPFAAPQSAGISKLDYRLFPGTPQLLSTLSKPFFGTPRMAIVSEQEVFKYNRQTTEDKRVEAIYLANNPPELDYHICISEADWVAPIQRAAALFFQPHLLSQEVQNVAKQEGFRITQDGNTTNEGLSKEFGVLPAPPAPFSSVPATRLTEAFADPRLLTPLTATMYVLDSSTSMQGPAFISAKRLIRSALEHENPDNPSGVIGFNSRVELVSPPTIQKRAIYPHLTGIAVNAGSSIYDAILLAAEELGRDIFKDYQRRIVVITDGNDQSSQTTLAYFGSELQRRINNREISLVTMIVPQPESVHTDLEEITSIFGGSMVDYNSNFSQEEFIEAINRS